MPDNLDPQSRSKLMGKVRGKDTQPEMVVRRAAHALRYRFRLHRRDLPGSPDLVFPSKRSVIFVHGCFWHRHPGCRRASNPGTKVEFWQAKFQRNIERDRRNEAALKAAGWRVLVVWECETKDTDLLRKKLDKFLGAEPKPTGRFPTKFQDLSQ